tara:strand:- start:795 stop:1442 length:648 start_codon:yes stop_codon:yes gene_type:complete
MNMLTKKQKELFDFLDQYIGKSGISPSFDEMKDALKLKSKSGVHRLITSLEQRGFINRLKHKARAMEIIKNPNNSIIANLKNNDDLDSLIPLIGHIAAGEPILPFNNPENEQIKVPLSLLSKNYQHFGLTVKGDSMIEAGILDGDIAIIKKTPSVNNGKIAAVLIKDEEVTLKKVKFQDSFIKLVPANSSFKEKTYQSKDIIIHGELKGLLRKYN